MPFLGPPSPAPVVHESTAGLPAPPPGAAGIAAGAAAAPGGNDDAGRAAADADGGRWCSRRCHRRPQPHSPRHHRYLAVIHPRLWMQASDALLHGSRHRNGCNVRTAKGTRSSGRVEHDGSVWVSLVVPRERPSPIGRIPVAAITFQSQCRTRRA